MYLTPLPLPLLPPGTRGRSEDDMAWLTMSFDMIGDIMQSSWPACTAVDPDDVDEKPFKADAIIANPVGGQCHRRLYQSTLPSTPGHAEARLDEALGAGESPV